MKEGLVEMFKGGRDVELVFSYVRKGSEHRIVENIHYSVLRTM